MFSYILPIVQNQPLTAINDADGQLTVFSHSCCGKIFIFNWTVYMVSCCGLVQGWTALCLHTDIVYLFLLHLLYAEPDSIVFA